MYFGNFILFTVFEFSSVDDAGLYFFLHESGRSDITI